MDPNESVGRRSEKLLFGTWMTITRTPVWSIAFVVTLAGGGTIFEFTNKEYLLSLIGILQLAAQYYLLVAMMRNAGLLPETRSKGFWSYFGQGIVVGLATIFGFVLLILPGVILLVRWTPSYGFLLGQNRGVMEALGESWEETRPHFWPILLATLPFALAYVAGTAISVAPELGYAFPALLGSVVANTLVYGATLFMTALGVATYAELAGQNLKFREVFS